MHVGTPIEKCREINSRLIDGGGGGAGGYEKDVFENLVYRYEEPNGMARWDSPLFTVLHDDEAPPCDAIWDAIVGSGGNVKVVKPNAATVLVRSLEPFLAREGVLMKLHTATSHRVGLSLHPGQNHPRDPQQHSRVAERPSGRRGPGSERRSRRHDRVADCTGIAAAAAEAETPVHHP